jgi:hypothetical protein
MVMLTASILSLACLCGGLFATVILAFQPPGPPKKLFQKPSFYIQIIAQALLVISAVLYHTGEGGAASSSDYGQWIGAFIVLPICALIGSAISKKAMAKQLAERQAKWEGSPEAERHAAEQAKKSASKGKKSKNKLMKMPNGDLVDEEGTIYKDGVGYHIDDDGNAYKDSDLFSMDEDLDEGFYQDADYKEKKKKKKKPSAKRATKA